MPPPKRVEQTDAIFEQLKEVNPEADRSDDTLRISIDAKATVPIGPFSRRGKSRTKTKAADHDFKPEATLTPFGIFLPRYDDLWLYMARSKVTSDFIADRLEQWWQEVRLQFLRVPMMIFFVCQRSAPMKSSCADTHCSVKYTFCAGYCARTCDIVSADPLYMCQATPAV